MATKRKITSKVILQSGIASKQEQVSKEKGLAEQETYNASLQERSDVIASDYKPHPISAGEETSDGFLKRERSKRECFFCKNKSNPSYTDLASLRRFLTDRTKILGKERSGICSKHQRAITKNIKYARHLSLLPFVPKV